MDRKIVIEVRDRMAAEDPRAAVVNEKAIMAVARAVAEQCARLCDGVAGDAGEGRIREGAVRSADQIRREFDRRRPDRG